jgi:5-deoxy-glucuronate isomerase
MGNCSITESACVFRATGSGKGRTPVIAPGMGGSRYLHYGRIILDASDAPVEFANGDRETGFICLRGSAEVRTRGGSFRLARYDALYIPRDSEITVLSGADSCDLVEVSAQVENSYPVQFVSFADVLRDPALHFTTGEPAAEREVSLLLGKNIQAGRIVAGLTVSKPGNWTSWPPHEHSAMLEEAYLFVDMPAPAWGVQFVYTDPKSPELVTVVREGDCVMIPDGFHPNLAAPGSTLSFIWMMAAQREREDRVFGVVNVQPDYKDRPSGLERGR